MTTDKFKLPEPSDFDSLVSGSHTHMPVMIPLVSMKRLALYNRAQQMKIGESILLSVDLAGSLGANLRYLERKVEDRLTNSLSTCHREEQPDGSVRLWKLDK